MLKAYLFDFENEARRPFDPDSDSLPDGCSQVIEMDEAKNVLVINPGKDAVYYRRGIRLGASAFTYHVIKPLIIITDDEELQ